MNHVNLLLRRAPHKALLRKFNASIGSHRRSGLDPRYEYGIALAPLGKSSVGKETLMLVELSIILIGHDSHISAELAKALQLVDA